jgi:hypothetical protein
VGQDPRLGYDDDGATILWALFDSFTTIGKNGGPAPELATSWKQTRPLT